MANEHPGIKLPQDWELIGFFEAEPQLAYVGNDDYGWQYNKLTFVTERGEDEIVCVIRPSYGELKLRWSRCGNMLVDLNLCFAEKLTLHSEEGREWMKTEFESTKFLLPLILQLEPIVQIEWGTTRWP